MRKIINQQEAEIFIEEYIIFLRKSRSDNPKETPEETLERHEQQLQEYAERELGSRIDEKNIYREVISGGEELENRPEFLKVLSRLEKGNIKGVLVVDPQRLSRSGMYGAGDIINAFYYTDTLIITPSKTYDLKNKYDKKFIEMELLQGAEYLGYVKEKLSIGRMTSVKEGKYVGSVTPFGYDKEKIKNEKGYKLVINENESEVVRMIFDLCLEGIGTSNIANALNKLGMVARKSNVWTPAMVRNILENPTYYGMLTWQKTKQVKKLKDGSFITKKEYQDEYILVKGLHEAIISEEEFKAAQDRLKNSNHPRRPSNIDQISNPLAGIVKCSVCGRSMIRRPYNKPNTKNAKRIHEVDKSSLLALLRERKEASGLSLNQIKDKLGDVSKDQVVSWFTPNINKFYTSKKFSEKWFELKEILNITTDEYDEALTTYGFDSVRPPSLMCSLAHCDTVASDLHLVEKRILSLLEERFNEYKYFLDNYEKEVVKEVKNNANSIKRINEQIEKKNNQLTRISEFYELGDYTRDQFLKRKKEINDELASLEAAKKEIDEYKEEDKIIKYKKAIPKLQDCIQNYDSYTVPQKNELLKSIIDKVIYSKKENGRWNPNVTFYLEMHTKI
jgi:DNA invertase Pin-like site-specific DNA recombinase